MAHGKLGGNRAPDLEGIRLRTAVVEEQGDAGNLSEPVASIEASEDRWIVGIELMSIPDTGEDGFSHVEASFSATATMVSSGQAGVDSSRSGIIKYQFARADSTNGWAIQTSDSHAEFESEHPVEWQEGRELNIHESNSLASDPDVRAIVYYVEADDC